MFCRFGKITIALSGRVAQHFLLCYFLILLFNFPFLLFFIFYFLLFTFFYFLHCSWWGRRAVNQFYVQFPLSLSLSFPQLQQHRHFAKSQCWSFHFSFRVQRLHAQLMCFPKLKDWQLPSNGTTMVTKDGKREGQ